MRRFLAGIVLFLILVLSGFQAHADLTAGETYTVVMSKVNSNGTVTQVNSTTAVADLNGKISFSFANVPTSPGTFFLVLTVKDSGGAVVRRSFVPAPPEDGTGQLGVNDLSTTQTDMILQALSDAATDDPIVVAYGLILTRTANLSDTDVASIALLGKLAIMEGFEAFLTDNGVTSSQLDTFKQKIVYNQPHRDLSNFTALFKSAVDNPDQASDDLGKAAGMIADIFIDAAVASGIDLGLIQAAHDASGDVVQNNPDAAAAFAEISGSTGSVINAAMSTFFTRIAAVKVKTSYTNALNTLDASGSQVSQFNAAVQTMVTAMENIDKQYAQYFENPELMTEEIKDAMNSAYQDAFTAFQGEIADSPENIADMKTNVATAIHVLQPEMTVDDIKNNMLPPDFGTYIGFDSQQHNWPIPQVVAVNKVAAIIIAGGSLEYDRSTMDIDLPVPANMDWLNGDGSRTDYVGMGVPAFFAALLGMQEDMQVAEHTRFYIWDPSNPDTGGHPDRATEKDAKLAYANNVELITSKLSGTTNGSTPISDDVKNALVKMMEHPELN